jgi:hypothetical protein
MKLKHLLSIVTICIGISGHGVAYASHISTTVVKSAFLSYFSGNSLTPQEFLGGSQNNALGSKDCTKIDCSGGSGLFFAAYDVDDLVSDDMFAAYNDSYVILDLGESVTIDNSYEIEITDIDGISLPGKLGAVSISDDNTIFDFAGEVFGTGDGTISLASSSGSKFRYIKIEQLNNPTGCSGNKTVCQTLALDSVIVNHDANVVPVPAAVWLFGSGLLGLVGVARRRSS